MQTIRITTSQNIDIDYELAGVGERIVAFIIDYAIFFLIYIAGIIISVYTKMADSTINVIIMLVIYGSLFVFYDLACEIFMNGQSVGKKVMKIKVVSLNGARPTLGQYLLRWLFRIVDFSLSFYMCGLITAVVSDKRQRLGDIVAGTTLIKTHPRTQINSVAFIPEASDYEPVFREALQLSDGDVELVHEVINTYIKTRNSVIVYNMATRIKEHLQVTLPPFMNDMQFLQTIVKDYNFLVAHETSL